MTTYFQLIWPPWSHQ